MQEVIQHVQPSDLSNRIRDILKVYASQNKSLIDQSFVDEKLNLKTLRKCNGNIELATVMIKEKLEKKQKRLEKRAMKPTKEQKLEKAMQEIKELGLEENSQKLINLGFPNLARNARLLKKFSGNIDKIIEILDKKRESKNATSQEKREKAAKKLEGLKKREERKAKREKIQKVACVEYENIPESISTIYLDGNNMLFCENEIRRLVLSHKRLDAEKVLSDITLDFAHLSKRFNFVLVFDRTSFSLNQQIVAEGKNFDYTVLSASPKYTISDDALVEWAQQQGENAKNCLFVTSDRELQSRLSESGVTDIMKPGRWLKLVKAALGEEKYNSFMNSKSE